MRWLFYFMSLLVISLLQMLLGPHLPKPAVHGEYLFLLAFYVALLCPLSNVVAVFFLSGLLRDVFLGSHLGLGTLSFTLSGIIVCALRSKISGEHFYTRFVFLFILLMFNLVIFSIINTRTLGFDVFTDALINAAYSVMLGPLFKIIAESLPLTKNPDRYRGLA